MIRLKDERLAAIAEHHNVARFASFSPGEPHLRYSVGLPLGEIQGREQVEAAIRSLFLTSRTVNVRTFLDSDSKSTEFVYGLSTIEDATAAVRQYSGQGLYTIVNETISVADGGVSGVSMANVTEFAPGGTPRLVEDPEISVARLPTLMAWSVLSTVYGFTENFNHRDGDRAEFSVHPLRVGHRNEHILTWEIGPANAGNLVAKPNWPNDFSRHVGDKAFGLLVGHLLRLPVPTTTVIGRRVAPFSFGRPTGRGETWLRTAPATATPGFFTTSRGWIDPFELLAKEDPDQNVVSVIAQEGVDAKFSGGAVSAKPGKSPLIEGVAGFGADFMSGSRDAGSLPESVRRDVSDLVLSAEQAAGPVQIEWAHDGAIAWLLQLHVRRTSGLSADTLSPGDASYWLDFDPREGLDKLRALVREASSIGYGIEVSKPIGITSHVGDILRKARVPGRIVPRID